MPFEKSRCDDCNRLQATCPECGEMGVSIDSIDTEWGSLTPDFADFAIYAATGDSIDYRLVCWECGFTEERTLQISKGLRPCGNYHPLPCGLDEDCIVPVEYFNADMGSEEIYEEFAEDQNE